MLKDVDVGAVMWYARRKVQLTLAVSPLAKVNYVLIGDEGLHSFDGSGLRASCVDQVHALSRIASIGLFWTGAMVAKGCDWC